MVDTVEGPAVNGTYVKQAAPSSIYYTSAKAKSGLSAGSGTGYRSFIYTNLPSAIRDRDVIPAAFLIIEMEAGTGSRTLTVQRHAKSVNPYTKYTWANQPGVLAGSSAVSVTQDSALTTWVFDVTADMQAIADGGLFYGWRIITTYTGPWVMKGWGSEDPPLLTVDLDETPNAPDGLGPEGVTAIAKPVFTWIPPHGLVSARIQIDEDGGDFTSPLFDSGTHATTLAQLDTNALGYSGITADATVLARILHTTSGGTSDWSDPIEVTRKALPTVAFDTPSSSHDPTPTDTWTAPDQVVFRYILAVDGKTVYDSGMVAGTDSAHTPPKGATKSGQVMTRTIRVWDDEGRVTSPGDPGYGEDILTTTYTPGTATAVNTLTVTQDGVNPWNDLAWTRAAGIPDEWMVTRDDEIVARFDGTDGGSPVLSWRDYTAPPNTTCRYRVVPITAGTAGAVGPETAARMAVDGGWVLDPATEVFFSVSADSLSVAYEESSVLYYPTGASKPTKRTFAMRGLEGNVGGSLDEYDGRTVAEQEADLFTIKASPTKTFRFVGGDVNIPVLVGDLTSFVDPNQSTTDRIVKVVSFTIAQNGELPFPEVAL